MNVSYGPRTTGPKAKVSVVWHLIKNVFQKSNVSQPGTKKSICV